MVFLLATVTALAQPHHGNRDRGARHHRLEKLTVEQLADLQTKRMILALELSEKQEKAVYQLHLDKAEKLKARRQEALARREAEQPAPRSNDEWYQRESARLDEQIAYQQSMKDILSEEQYEQFRRIHRERKKARAGKRMPGDGRSR